jgi:hypothetical protein
LDSYNDYDDYDDYDDVPTAARGVDLDRTNKQPLSKGSQMVSSEQKRLKSHRGAPAQGLGNDHGGTRVDEGGEGIGNGKHSNSCPTSLHVSRPCTDSL